MSYEQEATALKEIIENIQEKYGPQLEALSEKGKKLEEEYEKPSDIAVIGIDFKVDWKNVEITFDVPSISVENRSISLDLPQVSLSDTRVSFDVPDTRMVNKKIGQYPEFHGLKVVWRDIIVSVPEPYMRRVEISFGVPSVTMARQDFVIGIPKITMEKVKWVVGLPQFTIINVKAETKKIEGSGKALQAEGESLGQQMKQEIDAEVAKFKATLIATAFGTKTEVSNGYNMALGTIKGAIEDLQRQGCDPIKVPTENGNVNLRKVYEDMDAAKARSLVEIEHAIAS